MKKCQNCGNEFLDDATECPTCGVPYEEAKEEEKVEAQPEEEKVEAKEEKAEAEAKVFQDKPLKTNRGFFKYLILSIITLDIYMIVFLQRFGKDLNRIRQYYGDKKRWNYLPILLISMISLGIPLIVWVIRMYVDTHKYAQKHNVEVGSAVFGILGVTLLSETIVCPIISMVQLFKSMNNLCTEMNKL